MNWFFSIKISTAAAYSTIQDLFRANNDVNNQIFTFIVLGFITLACRLLQLASRRFWRF
jgi:phage-related protein